MLGGGKDKKHPKAHQIGLLGVPTIYHYNNIYPVNNIQDSFNTP